MFTLLSEAKFWSCKDGLIHIKDTDLGAFKYNDKKLSEKNAYNEGKRSYAEKRGLTWNPENKRPIKLKSALKRLEEELRQRKVVHCKWRNSSIIQLMFCNGTLVHVQLNSATGDIARIAFDKFLVGKLISESITDVIISKMHIIISYNENQITFTHLQKPSNRKFTPQKIVNMDPKIFNIIIGGPSSRKMSRNLVCNNSCDLLIIWTKSSQNEVYPWRPTVKDQDRANLHVYKINRSKLEQLCYFWTENDPICVEFSKIHENQIHSVEQKVSRKGDVTIEYCTYQINKTKLQRVAVTSIPLQTQVCCNAFSPDHEKLMLGLLDGSIVLFDEGRGITHLVKAAFIPTLISWHCDSALLMIANERCQFQCFDISLSCVKNQLISEDITPSNILDLSSYFSVQPTLLNICWSKKPDISQHFDKFAQVDCFLLLSVDNGPLACLRFVGGAGIKGDVHTSGFTADVLIHKYISLNQVEKAINVLLSLNWDNYGAMCLVSLHRIANYIFKQTLTPEREIQLQKALGSFHVPVKSLFYETETEFGDQVNDITRRFFHYLIRFKSFETAFSLAIDMNDADLFMVLHEKAKMLSLTELAEESFKKAEEINNSSNISDNDEDHSTCSNTSCSICSTDSSESEEGEEDIPNDVKAPDDQPKPQPSSNLQKSSSVDVLHHPPLPSFPRNVRQSATPVSQPQTPANYVPPLPYFPRNNNTNNNLFKQKVFIPKPELKASAHKKMYYSREKSLSSTNIHDIYSTTPTLKHANSGHLSNTPTFQESYLPGDNIDNLFNRSNYGVPNANIRFLGGHYDVPNHSRIKSPKALPRNTMVAPMMGLPQIQSILQPQQQQHHVVDIVPLPKEKFTLDQTIGIPIINDHDKKSHHNHINYFTSSSSSNPYSISEEDKYKSTSQIIHQYPLIAGNIPPVPMFNSKGSYALPEMETSLSLMPHSQLNPPKKRDIATNSILSNNVLNMPSANSASTSTAKKETGEKNKVKFSDTVVIAEIPRKNKAINFGDRPRSYHSNLTDPKRELADSLPLCHPNEDYLKDFTPMQDVKDDLDDEDDDSNEHKKVPSIKVVHFGIV